MSAIALYTGILGIILLVLSFKVVKQRQKYEIAIGDGDQEDLIRAMRVQGNFVEYVPLALLLLATSQLALDCILLTHIAGISLVIARILHAYGLGKTSGVSKGRFVGIILTWLVILVLSAANIYAFVLSLL